jgi:hypothetical protein
MEGIMKKILMTVISLILIAGSAYASGLTIAAGGKITETASGGALISSMSANVGGEIMSGTTNYAVELKHISGTRQFGTSSADTKIYYQQVSTTNQGTMTLDTPLTNSTSQDFMGTGWNSL